jgi:hypothetical protein
MKPRYTDIDVLLLLRRAFGGEWAVLYLLGDPATARFEQFLEAPTEPLSGPDDEWYLTLNAEEVVDHMGVITKRQADRLGRA